jgi:hypothetical protein
MVSSRQGWAPRQQQCSLLPRRPVWGIWPNATSTTAKHGQVCCTPADPASHGWPKEVVPPQQVPCHDRYNTWATIKPPPEA